MKSPLRIAPVVALAILLSGPLLRAALLQTIDDALPPDSASGATSSHDDVSNTQPVLTDKPVRGGVNAFRHVVGANAPTSELVAMSIKPGSAYWYGWSLQVPEKFQVGTKVTVMRLTGAPTATGAKSPCGVDGACVQIDEKGRLVLHLLHPATDGVELKCDEFVLVEDMTKTDGKWVDLVMHAKWSSEKDGFLECWSKFYDNNFLQRANYTGSTWWPGAKSGPEFRMGARLSPDSGAAPPELTIFTDEFRLGDEQTEFNDVAPGAGEVFAAEAGKGKTRYVLYPSALNRAKIPIMVYTPPGYDLDQAKRYPVIYNLHGAGGGSPARQWARMNQTLTQAMDSGAVSPVIYVFVNGLGDNGFIDVPVPGAPQTFSSIVTELIPFIDTNYRTIADRRGRAVDGFSMGAGGAILCSSKRPDLFCASVSYAGVGVRVDPAMAKDPKFAKDPKMLERLEYMQGFSPWALVERQADYIRANVRVRLVCGDKDPGYAPCVAFKERLDSLQIPVSWVSIPDVAHETKVLFDRVGIESLKFIHAAFAEAGKN